MIKTAHLLTFLFFLNSFAYGQDTTQEKPDYHLGFRIAPRISTLGGGLEFAKGLTPSFGLVYSGSPKAAVSLSGNDAAIATASGDVQKEINDLQESLDDFEWWPVLSAGLVYQF